MRKVSGLEGDSKQIYIYIQVKRPCGERWVGLKETGGIYTVVGENEKRVRQVAGGERVLTAWPTLGGGYFGME